MSEGSSLPRQKTVGVIGGMGPAATVDFMHRLVEATPVRAEEDHLHVLIDNNPKVPSRIAAIVEGEGEDPTPVLRAMAQGLEAQGAELLVIPCNTAHYYSEAIAQSVRIPVLDMVSLSVAKLQALIPRPIRVGVLASPAVRMVGLYNARLRAAGFEVLFASPEDEPAMLDLIVAIKTGRLEARHRQDYSRIAQGMIAAGADAFLIACTELSLIGPPEDAPLPVIDALNALVEETVRSARGV